MEEKIMQLIVHGGDARSKALSALSDYRNGLIEEGDAKMKQAKESLNLAHNTQTTLIQDEIRGEKTDITLLIIHAQDHLMNAITVIDLVKEIKENILAINELKNK